MRNKRLSYCVKIAVLSAVAIVIQYIFSLFPSIAFYKIDFSDLPALIGGFALGPLAAFWIEAIKILINPLLTGSYSMGLGEAANFLCGVLLAVPASLVYKKYHSKKGALAGVALGTAVRVIVGCLFNAFVLIPVYTKAIGIETALSGFVPNGSLPLFILFFTLPINFINGGVTSLITMLIYKPLSPLLKK